MKNFLRPLVYLGAFVLLVVAILIKKDIVVAKRSVEAVSIDNERQKHGMPVDVLEVHPRDFTLTTPVSVRTITPNQGEFFVTEELRRRIFAGTALLDAEALRPIGSIERLAPQRDLQTGLYRVLARIPEGSEFASRFRTSGHETVAIPVRTRKNVLSVPSDALLRPPDGPPLLWVMGQDNLAARREVETGLSNGVEVEIIRGLSPGDRVIIEGHREINESSRLRQRNTLSTSAKNEASK